METQSPLLPPRIVQSAERLLQRCLERGVRVVFAESCTGGLLSAAVTSIPGSSRVLDRGFVVYSNESKEQELGVPRRLIEEYGAVSEPVAIEMAKGALAQVDGHAQLSIAVTGVAGPEGTPAKPAGLVHIAAAMLGQGHVRHERHDFGAIGRENVRAETVVAAFDLAMRWLEE
jgi:nicotinamide-nucleotide amidase